MTEPISTAPRDGTVIWGRYEGEHPGWCAIAWWPWPGCAADWCEAGPAVLTNPAWGDPVRWKPYERALRANRFGVIEEVK